MSVSFPSPVLSIKPPLYCRRLSSAERARLSHAQATFLMSLGPFVLPGAFPFSSSEPDSSELTFSKSLPRVVPPPRGVLSSSSDESVDSSPSFLLGRKSKRPADLLSTGRETTNSVGAKPWERDPSKDTRNSVSAVLNIFPFLDKKLLPKNLFFRFSKFFEPIRDLGSIKFTLLGMKSVVVVVLSLHTITVGTPLINSYKWSESSELLSQHTDFVNFSSF